MIYKSYSKKGDKILNMNYAAVDKGVEGLVEIKIPSSWGNAIKEDKFESVEIPDYIKNILIPINAQEGDKLPVSIFSGREDGTVPLGTSAYEKRGIAVDVPVWNIDNCIQCNQCSLVCPHAAIRPFIANEEETKMHQKALNLKKLLEKVLRTLTIEYKLMY